MKIEIDLEEFAEQVKNGKSVTSKGGVLNKGLVNFRGDFDVDFSIL